MSSHAVDSESTPCQSARMATRTDAFGKALRELRLSRGLSQGELAKRVGAHRATISKIEVGARMPSVAMLVALADALGASMQELQLEPPKESHGP